MRGVRSLPTDARRSRAGGNPASSLGLGLVRAFLLFFAVAAGVADAHHAWNEIDTAKSLTLTGTIRSLKWENPHASLMLRTTDRDATVDWIVQMSGPARMESRGLTEAAIAVGKVVTIVASPARGDAHVVRANRIRADDREYVLY